MDVVSRRLGGLLGLAVAIAVVWAGPAPAMTGGQLDGGPPDFVEHHPNVGALLVKVSNSELRQVCSGSVLSPTEFVTAGHCTAFLTAFLTALGPDAEPKDNVFVSFESNLRNPPLVGPIDPTTKIPATDLVTDPRFRTNPAESKAYDDVGVVHLQSAVDRTPVKLPTAGSLDAQAAGGGLRGHIFETVGYGDNFIDRSVKSPQAVVFKIGARVFTTLPFMSLTPYFLKLQGNTNATSNTTDVDPATGLGGACFGDSGGPTFDPGTGLQVAVTTAGPPTCQSVNEDQRLDTASVLAFLFAQINQG
jgi:Trypsin